MSLLHIRSVYGIMVLKQKHRTIKDLQKSTQQPSLHGHQAWHSSFLVMDYLLDNPLDNGLRIMEIGCGWGLLGIFCAKSFEGEVLLTDADQHVFPYTQAHLTLNEVDAKLENIRYEDLEDHHFAGNDIIVGGDICFWTDMIKQLQALFHRAFLLGVKQIIIADPGRVSFMALARHCKETYSAQIIRRKLPNKSGTAGYILIANNPLAQAC